MSILETLTLSETTKHSETIQPHLMLRRRMVNAINEQIVGATAEAKGEHYVRNIEKWVFTDKNAGIKERRTVQRPFRKMWWPSDTGLMLELRFANKAVKVSGKATIVVGEVENLVPTLQKVKQAVQTGEFDAILKAITESRKKATGKKNGKPTGSK
ncbi:MAG: DUF6641 family protein [Rhodospirillaceae bacterium]